MKKISFFLLTPLLISCNGLSKLDLMHKLPSADEILYLNEELVNRTSLKSIKSIEKFLHGKDSDDIVISPASFLLSVTGLGYISDNFNFEAYGINQSKNDLKQLLTAWNYEYKDGKISKHNYSYLQSCVLHQQVGDLYKFDQTKRNELLNNYISTLVSSSESYKNDAEIFFRKKLDIDITPPDANINGNGVITYGAISLKDYVPDGLNETQNEFHYKTGDRYINTYEFARESFPKHLSYYENSLCQVFNINIRYTSLLVVLPKLNIDIDEINISEAFEGFQKYATTKSAYGYIPYFHNKTNNINLSDGFKDNVTGNEIFYSKLLSDSVYNDLQVDAILQTSDFEFNKYGISGKSITSIPLNGSSGPSEEKPINLSVNRPFYVFSLKDNFPLFVCKVSNP